MNREDREKLKQMIRVTLSTSISIFLIMIISASFNMTTAQSQQAAETARKWNELTTSGKGVLSEDKTYLVEGTEVYNISIITSNPTYGNVYDVWFETTDGKIQCKTFHIKKADMYHQKDIHTSYIKQNVIYTNETYSIKEEKKYAIYLNDKDWNSLKQKI